MIERKIQIEIPAGLREPETPRAILKALVIGISHNAVLATLIERGRISESEVAEIMTTQGGTFYQNRDLRRTSRQLGLSEEERQSAMVEAFRDARKFLVPTSSGDQING